jgi:cytoskeletal protein CcmA (bactofilin family)
MDGDTSASATTVVDADRVVFNDAGTMKQVAVTDLAAYFDDEITAMPNLVTTAATTVGALNSGSITSGFGTIDTGSSTITTTGLITGGSLDIDDVVINGTTIGHTDDTDLMTVASGLLTVAGEVSMTTLDIGGTNVTATAAELNYSDTGASVGTVVASKVVTVDANKDVASFRNITLTGELDAGSLDVSGDADIDGTLEADAITIAGVTLAETISDTVGAMVSSNTETGVSVSYDDSDNTLDFVLGTAQTTIESVKNTSLVIGRDDDNLIKFSTDNQIIFEVSGGDNVIFKASGEIEASSLDISGDADIDGTLEADAITVNGTALNTVIAGVTVANATLAATATVTDSTANTNFPVVFHDESNALLDDTGALRYNPSTGELLVPKLTVAGTTTTVDTVTMNAENAIIFEGATADAHETTLTIVDPTADRTINLPNQSGTVPVLAAASNTAITSTPDELNILDGATVVVGEINALDLGSTAVGTAIASKAVILDSNKDYTGIRNFTITGELDAGSLDISGDADIDGTLEADAITVNGATLNSVIVDEATSLAIALG